MEISFRRVFGFLVGSLLILWIVMLAWAAMRMMPELFSGKSDQKIILVDSANDPTGLIRVPGIHFSSYQTVHGDTFSKLSKKFELLEPTLRSLNEANDKSEPKNNSCLLIPSRDGVFHIVRSGQGLSDISRSYGTPLKEILRANQKNNDSDIQPGEILFLPEASYLTRQDVRWLFLLSLATKKGFLKPTSGRFADGFGKRRHPITGKLNFHEGLDLAPGWRARVVASQEGPVIFAAMRAGYGRLIILDHGGGVTSWYAHLDEILVKPHQWVKQGQLIGKVGKSGSATGPHLHFEIRLNGLPKNPFLYLVQ